MVQHHPALNPPPAPTCSVCIANYNGVAMLADCLDSVLSQRGHISCEIIVHDDASTDDSVAFMRRRYPQVELLASTDNVGFCVSNNRMVAHARGEFVLLLNNDAALNPDALLCFLEAARARSSHAILTLPQYDWASGELVDRGCLLDPFYNPVPNVNAARKEVAYVIGACLWMPRVLWIELGGLPEWMESLGEDLYLGCTARLRGHAVSALPVSGYRHRQGASFGGNREDAGTLQTTFRRRRLSERNKTAAMIVCTPTPLVWPVLFTHLVLLAFEGTVLALVRRDRRVWREVYGAAMRQIWLERRVLRATRLRVQATRRITVIQYFAAFTCMPRKLVLLVRYGWPRFLT